MSSAYNDQQTEDDMDNELPLEETAESVLVDALVVLKIASHARDSPSTQVTGALLGTGVGNVLEVTWCYSYLDDDQDQEQYQFDMMKALRDVNIDANNVGWYHAAPLGSFANSSWLNILHEFHTSIANSIVLEYDPVRTVTGALTLRAFCLTSKFLNFYKSKDPAMITTAAVLKAGLSHADIFQELPVQIRNSHLLSALVYELEDATEFPLTPNLDCLAVRQPQYLEKNIDALMESLDEYNQDQGKYQFWSRQYQRERTKIDAQVARKRQDNSEEADLLQRQLSAKLLIEPSRLDSLLLTQQIIQQCQQLVASTEPSLVRLYSNAKVLNPQ